MTFMDIFMLKFFIIMSRSRIKTPILGIASVSDKEGKRQANRAFRRNVHMEVLKGKEIVSLLREVSNVWDFPKDGKRYWKNLPDKYLRK
jgi:hypothetical protein